MKQILTLIFFLLNLNVNLNGQYLTPQVIASIGGFASNDAGSLSWTVGETFTATYSSDNLFLTQGFQQPDFMVVSAENIIMPDFNVKVFPNPATDFIRVEWETPDQTEIHVELYDLVGRRISQEKSDNSVNHIQMDLQSFQRSAYLLKVYSKDGKFSKTYRIIKY
ncbi:MAG: T9SS type A sorting domain-containing protein [Bacteroidales bacterium]